MNNVFKRTVQCLSKYKPDYFIRINADRPFVDTNEIKKMVSLIKRKKDIEIITNNLGKCPSGLTSEIAKSRIFKSYKKDLKKAEKEHLFKYFYNNKKKYNILYLKNELYIKNYKLNLALDNLHYFRKSKRNFLVF